MIGERAPEPKREMSEKYWKRFEQSAIERWNRRAATRQAVSETHVLMPKQPTKDIIDAARDQLNKNYVGDIDMMLAYEAAISAAQKEGT